MTDSILGRFWSVWTGSHRFPETPARRRHAGGTEPEARTIERRWFFVLWFAAFSLGYAFSVVFSVLISALSGSRPHNTIEDAFNSRSALWVLLIAVVFAPLLEETAFRLPATRTPWAIGLGAAIFLTVLADTLGFSSAELLDRPSPLWLLAMVLGAQVLLLGVPLALLARRLIVTANPTERADQRLRQVVVITLTLVFALLHTFNFSNPTALTTVMVFPQLFVGSVLMFARIDRSWWLGVVLHACNNLVAVCVSLAGRVSPQVGAAVSAVFFFGVVIGGAFSWSKLISEHRDRIALSRLPIVPVTLDPRNMPSEAPAVCDALRRFGAFATPIPSTMLRDKRSLDPAAARFFSLDPEVKDRIAMRHAGAAWRGWFPFGGELTGGVTDRKEGLYFGREQQPAQSAVRPLSGPNQWPAEVPELRAAVERHMANMEEFGRHVLQLVTFGLGAPPDAAQTILGGEPTTLFRIFHYPPSPAAPEPNRPEPYGVGAHTDYGLLTLLATNGQPGLQIRTSGGWIDAPSNDELLIVNVGETLARLAGGRIVAAEHRVRDVSGDRISYPFFLDPHWDFGIDDAGTTYGAFLVEKVARVFPELAAAALPNAAAPAVGGQGDTPSALES